MIFTQFVWSKNWPVELADISRVIFSSMVPSTPKHISTSAVDCGCRSVTIVLVLTVSGVKIRSHVSDDGSYIIVENTVTTVCESKNSYRLPFPGLQFEHSRWGFQLQLSTCVNRNVGLKKFRLFFVSHTKMWHFPLVLVKGLAKSAPPQSFQSCLCELPCDPPVQGKTVLCFKKH